MGSEPLFFMFLSSRLYSWHLLVSMPPLVLTCSPGGAIPPPVRNTVCGEPAAESATDFVVVKPSTEPDVNFTAILHDALAADSPQSVSSARAWVVELEPLNGVPGCSLSAANPWFRSFVWVQDRFPGRRDVQVSGPAPSPQRGAPALETLGFRTMDTPLAHPRTSLRAAWFALARAPSPRCVRSVAFHRHATRCETALPVALTIDKVVSPVPQNFHDSQIVGTAAQKRQ